MWADNKEVWNKIMKTGGQNKKINLSCMPCFLPRVETVIYRCPIGNKGVTVACDLCQKCVCPRVWEALGKVTLLFLWHESCVEGVRRLPPSVQSAVLPAIDNCYISWPVFVTLFSVFACRSQWTDSEIHQAEDRQNSYKETGKLVFLTSLALIRIITHRFVSSSQSSWQTHHKIIVPYPMIILNYKMTSYSNEALVNILYTA